MMSSEVRPIPIDEPAASESRGVRRTFDAILVVLFVAIAGLIARGPLGPPSLWLDDAWPALVVRVPWSQVSVVGLTSSGYSVVLKAWMHLAGFSEVHAQMPAFVFGALGPAALYVTARKMKLPRVPALIAGTILLVSHTHVVYSTRVKQYTLDALLATVVIYLALGVMEDPLRAGRWVALVAMAIVATAASSLVVTTVAGALLAASLAAWKARTSQPGNRIAVYAIAGYGLFAVFWWLVALRPHINPALKSYWSHFYIRLDTHFPRDLWEAVLRIARGLSSAPSILGVIVLVASAVIVIRRKPQLAVLLLTPVAVGVVLATMQVAPLGAGRTDLNLYPALALLVALAVNELRGVVPAPRIIAAVVLVAIATTVRTAPPYPIEDMSAKVAYLEKHSRTKDEVLVYWPGRYPFSLYATAWPIEIRRSRATAEGFEVRVDRPNLHMLADHSADHDAYLPELTELTRGQSRVWFIGSHGRFDVVTIQKDLVALGFSATRRRPGNSYRAFVTLWIRKP